jgi:hypothetical protein
MSTPWNSRLAAGTRALGTVRFRAMPARTQPTGEYAVRRRIVVDNPVPDVLLRPDERAGAQSRPMKVILDSNIYDRLHGDVDARALARRLIDRGNLIVVVTRTIAEVLYESPFQGVPDFFPTEYEGNTVSQCGIMCCGDHIGPGDVFDAHLGNSRKVNDALIADAASWFADQLVSEDLRLRTRLADSSLRCKVMSYGEFRAWLVAAGADDMSM